MGSLQSILVIILTLLTFTANGYSVCDALDVFLLIDTEFIIQDADNILSIIDGIIVDGSNEDTGFSAIIFGDIPQNMDNLLFNIDATHKVHRRQKQISFINEKLSQTFATIQNNAGINTQRISLRDALNTAYNEEKPKRNHKNKAKHGNKVGHHNDDDVMIIFDYNGQHTILDPEILADILAEFNTADDKEITFILGQWFDEFSNTSLAILNETREIISDSDAQHLFFPIYAFTPNSNMRDFLYLNTCPGHVEIDRDHGYDANLKNNVQYIEPETFLSCHYDSDTSDTSDTLFVYVYQDLSDESTATFAINGILMTDLETEENELPVDCDRVLYVIQNIIILDDHREIFVLLTEEQKAGNFQILEIETSVPTNISDYVRSMRASGTSPVVPNVVRKNKKKNKNKRSLVDLVNIDKSDSITLNNPFDFAVTFTLQDTVSKGYEKKMGKCKFKIDGTVTVAIALELSLALSNFNAFYDLDISFGISCSGDWWNPTSWNCHMSGNFHVEFIVSGDISLGAEPSLSISGYSVVSLECVYEPDTLVWILVIPVYYTPIIKIKSEIKTRPLGVSVGLDCDYNFRFRLGAIITGEDDDDVDEDESSTVITEFNQLPDSTSTCTPYYSLAGLETCGYSLGFEWSLTVTGGLRLYSLVEVTVAATVGIPFVVKIPDIDQCNGCNNGARGGASFAITLTVKAGFKFGAVGVLDEMYKAWKGGGEDKKYDKLAISVMVTIVPKETLLTVQLGCFSLPAALSDFLVNSCDCANPDFVFVPSNDPPPQSVHVYDMIEGSCLKKYKEQIKWTISDCNWFTWYQGKLSIQTTLGLYYLLDDFVYGSQAKMTNDGSFDLFQITNGYMCSVASLGTECLTISSDFYTDPDEWVTISFVAPTQLPTHNPTPSPTSPTQPPTRTQYPTIAATVNCVSVIEDAAPFTASCAGEGAGYVLTSCGVEATSSAECNGISIKRDENDDPFCATITGNTNGDCIPIAQCCNIGSSIISRTEQTVTANMDVQSNSLTSSCDVGEYLLGCTSGVAYEYGTNNVNSMNVNVLMGTELLLHHKNMAYGYFDPNIKNTGTENLNDLTANTWSKIGSVTNYDEIYRDLDDFYTFYLKYNTPGSNSIPFDCSTLTGWTTHTEMGGTISAISDANCGSYSTCIDMKGDYSYGANVEDVYVERVINLAELGNYGQIHFILKSVSFENAEYAYMKWKCDLNAWNVIQYPTLLETVFEEYIDISVTHSVCNTLTVELGGSVNGAGDHIYLQLFELIRIPIFLKWKQTSWLTDNTVTGYSPIDVKGEAVFDGLKISTSPYAYLEGNDASDVTWIAVGEVDINAIHCGTTLLCDSVELYVEIHTLGKELLLRHRDVSEGYFNSDLRNTGNENENDMCANTYSKIGDFTNYDNYRDVSDYLRFYLIYVTVDDQEIHIEWKQTSWLTESSITGYVPINVPTQAPTARQFAGLGLSNLATHAYLDGNGGGNTWWNGVGTFVAFQSGIPCFNGNVCKSVSLYIEFIAPNEVEVDTAGKELLLRHRDEANGYFSPELRNTGKENENDDICTNTYSKIGVITDSERYRDADGFFAFALKYITNNDEAIYIEWKQTSWLTESTVVGYTPIHVPTESSGYPDYKFTGLGLSSYPEYGYLDGDGQGQYWWNEVGTFVTGGLPCFDGNFCKSVSLYIIKFAAVTQPTCEANGEGMLKVQSSCVQLVNGQALQCKVINGTLSSAESGISTSDCAALHILGDESDWFLSACYSSATNQKPASWAIYDGNKCFAHSPYEHVKAMAVCCKIVITSSPTSSPTAIAQPIIVNVYATVGGFDACLVKPEMETIIEWTSTISECDWFTWYPEGKLFIKTSKSSYYLMDDATLKNDGSFDLFEITNGFFCSVASGKCLTENADFSDESVYFVTISFDAPQQTNAMKTANDIDAMKIRDGRYNISPGIMVVGLGLLVLSVSMIMINYVDCGLKERMKRISFNKNVGNGYDPVKLNESDIEEENPML